MLRKALGSVAVLLGMAGGAAAETVTVFAASSLREALEDVAALYEEQTGDTVVLVFAASSSVARQVAQGAPADAVVLADQAWADWLAGEVETDFAAFAGNRLVVASSGRSLSNIESLPDALGPEVLAMAQVDAVPAGRYGKEALTILGLWEAVFPDVVQAANVRAALRFVERGDAIFGIGYASDLVALPTLTSAYEFPPATHSPIRYLVGSLSTSGQEFADFLTSPDGAHILTEWGFAPPPAND